MWNSDDCVPRKDVKSPYGGVVSPLPGKAGGPPPAMFPVGPALLADEPQLDSWQVAVVRVDETPAGDSSEQDSPCDSQNRRRPKHAATQSTTSLWERFPAQPEPRRGGGLVERISEGITYLEHPAQGVSLDSRPMEGSLCLKPVEQSILRSPRITQSAIWWTKFWMRSRQYVRFRARPWTVNLWRGLPSQSR